MRKTCDTVHLSSLSVQTAVRNYRGDLPGAKCFFFGGETPFCSCGRGGVRTDELRHSLSQPAGFSALLQHCPSLDDNCQRISISTQILEHERSDKAQSLSDIKGKSIVFLNLFGGVLLRLDL